MNRKYLIFNYICLNSDALDALEKKKTMSLEIIA